eukprot:scaffold821_cov129-Ochromonas_danica.AAC.1
MFLDVVAGVQIFALELCQINNKEILIEDVFRFGFDEFLDLLATTHNTQQRSPGSCTLITQAAKKRNHNL